MTTCAAVLPSIEWIDGAARTTAGVIALGNLDAQIDGFVREAAAGRVTVKASAGLIELVVLRGHVVGCIGDYEWAVALAEQLTRDAPSDAHALLSRARSRAVFHRFTAALTDLDGAEHRGADRIAIDAERAAIFQAVGRYDEALAIYRAALERRADFHSLGDVATLYAERGDFDAAEHSFEESRARYRGVSPIPLAQLDFKRAHMYMTQGDLPRARAWLDEAVRRLPGYAPAAGHLAEVEAALGDTDAAVARLVPLVVTSDDPDYAAQLARILGDIGQPDAARAWRDRAAARYDELVAQHPEAFADHAAGFWLAAGADPGRALSLAQENLAVRPTRRAAELVEQARRAQTEPAVKPAGHGAGRSTHRRQRNVR